MSAVGFKDPSGKVKFSDSVPLLADDKELTIRIFLDNVVAECYWQDGRVAMTVPIAPASSLGLSSNASVSLLNGTSYGMTEIMTTKEAVLATPRLL